MGGSLLVQRVPGQLHVRTDDPSTWRDAGPDATDYADRGSDAAAVPGSPTDGAADLR
ncbi:MAG: hypothetical protein HY909_29365 [Deltaproteobacteria bacterium]|nr:hypothetical protein [Deltaproteobacteria bacterium]